MMNDKKIPGKRRRRCSNCNKLKYGVITQINPYTEDINGIKVKEPLCPDCYESLQRDI
jgi:ribosomal protein S27AE